MSGAHTPGPLNVRKTENSNLTGAHWREIVSTDDDAECVLGEVFESDTGAAQAEANALLWAAGPEMLEALYQYVSDLRYPPTGDSIQRRIERAEAVIAKATGETL